jgi:hypothetical protein
VAIPKMTAVIVQGDGVRYEKDLRDHFFRVAFWNTFPPFNETDAARKHWATRIIQVD